MANLKDRLKRIHEQKKNEVLHDVSMPSVNNITLTNMGWDACGFNTLKREITVDAPFNLQKKLPPSLAIVIPDLAGRSLPELEDFLFFDLETTGLSGGAGTLAFLAAFGKPLSDGKLHVTQYLLLDYPGESDFLDAVLREFKNENSVIVSYNGKCFDSQILKTRCLMNGIRPPEYCHADLLHPARRLWKNIIFDCSQASVEAQILGIDRSGDTPGSLAPEIWFEFLKTGRTERLISICDHNCADIKGLASILAAMILIACDPLTIKLTIKPAAFHKSKGEHFFDIERLALYWRYFMRKTYKGDQYDNLQITGKKLLRLAAEKKCPRAAFVYAQDQLYEGNFSEGRKKLLDITEMDFPHNIKASALRALAVDSERRLKCFKEALYYSKRGLELKQAGPFWKTEFERRIQRLEKKVLC